jgi:hypothetical protein
MGHDWSEFKAGRGMTPVTADGEPARLGMSVFADNRKSQVECRSIAAEWVPCGILSMAMDESRDNEPVARVRSSEGWEWDVDVADLYAAVPAEVA